MRPAQTRVFEVESRTRLVRPSTTDAERPSWNSPRKDIVVADSVEAASRALRPIWEYFYSNLTREQPELHVDLDVRSVVLLHDYVYAAKEIL